MPQDLISLLEQDHREIEDSFRKIELELETPNRTQSRELKGQIISGLVKHSVVEEIFLYPTARKALSDGDRLIDQELADHAEAEGLLSKLDAIDVDEEQYPKLMRKLIHEIREHVADEEGYLFPNLKKACTSEQLLELGTKAEKAKKLAPTHPHPSAPNKPPMNIVFGLANGFIDKVRDAMNQQKQ